MADVELLLIPWLAAQRPDARVVAETPANVDSLPWAIRVARAGGPQKFTIDRARVVLHTFAIKANGKSARENTAEHAQDVNDLMRWQLKGVQLGPGCWVCRVDVDSAPTFVPEPNTAMRHTFATYTLHLSDH